MTPSFASHPIILPSTSAPVRARVLVVDDDPGSRALIESILERDYDVAAVSSGAAALEMLHAQPMDAVLLDIMMPGMTGMDLLRSIRADQLLADLPVILISGRNESESIVAGLQSGASDYISKPFNVPILHARVKTQLALKQLNDAYKTKIEQLHQTQEMQERFIRIVAHDLKGPLTNLRMAQYLLRELVGDSEQVRAILDSTDATLNDMQELIRTFLDASEYRPGKMMPHPEDFNAAELVSKVIEQNAFAAEKKAIRVLFDPEPLSVQADLRYFSQITGNLLGNAIKYSPANTTVTLTLETDGHVFRLAVADQGPGIAPEERDRLFQMFGRLSSKPTGGESSTGLGLWIVKILVEAQGGTVELECPPEGGSIFSVYLPVHVGGVPEPEVHARTR